MKILISSPRCGSTFVSKYFDKYNMLHMKCKYINTFSEYLLTAQHGDQTPIKSKIKYIELCRSEGTELLYKIHAFHLFQNNWINKWFFDFYKDADIYVLKRKDLWAAYTSLLVHYKIGRKLWHNDGTKRNELIKMLQTENIKHDPNVMKAFLWQQECLNRIEGNILYLEDLNHSKMCNLLNVNIEEPYKPWNINYENYIC